ncbi:IclR family transcriptional regulator [Gordonia iterans]
MVEKGGGVQSVERAFEILELIGRAGGECSLSHLAAESPLPPPTIHRLLRTLVGLGYVLAELDDARIVHLVTQAGLTRLTGSSISSLSGVFAEVEKVREQGFAVDREEHEPGVCGLAVAVPGAPTPMAVGVSGPLARVDEAMQARAIRALRDAADALSLALIGARER